MNIMKTFFPFIKKPNIIIVFSFVLLSFLCGFSLGCSNKTKESQVLDWRQLRYEVEQKREGKKNDPNNPAYLDIEDEATRADEWLKFRQQQKARLAGGREARISEMNQAQDAYRNETPEQHRARTTDLQQGYIQKRKTQRNSSWNKGYEHGWDIGYDDGVNGREIYYCYDESNKKGDYLRGYSSGYEDGYTDGHNEWKEKIDSL